MTEAVDLGGAIIYMLHDLADLDLDPQEAGFAVVLTGHTHRPQHEEKNGVLYLNPGSASQPRGGLPPSVARMTITDGVPQVKLVTLT
jgi:putative phosphoesterase